MRDKGLKGDELAKVITKINNQCIILQNHLDTIDKITHIADGLRTKSKKELDNIIDLANAHKRAINEQINEIIDEIKKME
tara:strand:+ start:245 stop:484 length:240 start_codon:yes stop_codon:yes gene_type:complete